MCAQWGFGQCQLLCRDCRCHRSCCVCRRCALPCGGDWQEPVSFDIVVENGGYVCKNVKQEYNKGLTSYEFLRKLFEVEDPERILNTDRVKLMDWWEKEKWGEKEDY